MLALKQREEIDNRSIGDLFYLMVDELSDLSFVVAFKQLIELFKKISADELVLDDETLNNIISEFLSQLPKNYQRVFW
ncbi:hypothetical protein SAMN02745116_02156 [Pilibacter termitis]|uniref:Uncharacterized protein n=1 Tax=Pilibacter termitis TaxID=263852 RepID=A0A1T4K8M9_9ENTE|nr:hypothetical protein SAMN02745116_00157 [Pilibacter termitis]SKA01919.1 hypothetical protein SAMN02745116_02156 [Pilibacter termitis]